MTDYINNIAVDLDIYSKWPEELKDMSIVFVPKTDQNPYNLIIVSASDQYPAKQVVELEEFPDTHFHGRILWIIDGEKAPVSGIFIEPEYRNHGVAKFLCILARTWVAEKFNVKIFSPELFRTGEVEEILKSIAIEYNEKDLVVRTVDGEYKPFGEINDLQEELGV